MRAVFEAADLAAAIESAQREAQAAFGDGTVFCEPLLTRARHVEVQVLADAGGTVWALTERDCSVQRRYAKVIEESPSPAVGPALRDRLLSAAAALARAVGYVSAGTVEFLVGESGPGGEREFYFLEFNTRLQVEHPVTECVHGLDLVGLQLAIADGRPLPGQPPPERPAMRSRPASTPRTRPTGSGPPPARCTRSTCPASMRRSACRLASPRAASRTVRSCDWTPGSSLVRWSPRTTTRCWPR